mgnify:FL=1
MESYQAKSIQTFSQTLNSDSKPLAALKVEFGVGMVEAGLMKIISENIKFFALGKSMDNLQVIETAKLIVGEYYYFKLEDFKLFFTKFKRGEYGNLYDRLDGQVIMIALNQYREERLAEAERLNHEKHKKLLEAEKESFYLVKIGSNWLRSNGDNFEEVEQKELATNYTQGEAYNLKAWLQKEYYSNPNHVLVYDSRNCKSVFDYLEEKKPELLPYGEKSKRATKEYFEAKEKIMADTKLNDFEKENALRVFAKLEPITEEEWIARKK